jgi:hypothetical protein
MVIPRPVRFIDFVCVLNGSIADVVIDVFAGGQLLFDHVSFGDVLEPARPFAGLQTNDTADDLGNTLEGDQRARDRDHGLEVVDGRPISRGVGILADAPAVARERIARVDECQNAGEEKQEVQDQVECRLRAWLERAVEKVTADMAILGERVSAAHHEQRAVEHVGSIKDPGGRLVQSVALEDLSTDQKHKADNQPSRPLADEGIEPINGMQKFLNTAFAAFGFGRHGFPQHSLIGPRFRRGQDGQTARKTRIEIELYTPRSSVNCRLSTRFPLPH